MMTDRKLDQTISTWLAADAPGQLPDRVLRATFERTRMTGQQVGWRAVSRRLQMNRSVFALGSTAALVVFAAVALGIYVNNPRPDIGGQPTATPSPTASSSPARSPSPGLSRCREVEVTKGTVLGCSRDGTRLLIQNGYENLFVLHADGSETQVTDWSGFKDIPGSGRPTGATISPDGSRVVFAGLTKTPEGIYCHNGALFAVDADGGPAEVLWTSQAANEGGIVSYPMFSPDGTQIAFEDGYCDSRHSVWVMNADGSDAHQIVSSAMGSLGATHLQWPGLAWSAAGDQIALLTDKGTYSFATDGSDFTRGADVSEYCWPGRKC
jgi:hypothetical protein